MNKLFVSGVVLACCLAACLSDQLCVPDQMQGDEVIFSAMPFPQITEYNKFYYDAANKMKLKVISTIEKDGKPTPKYHLLIRYDNGVGTIYAVALRESNKCAVLNIKWPFERHCLPVDAKTDGPYYIGPIDDGLEVNGFFEKRKLVHMYLAAHTEGNMLIPASSKFFEPLFHTYVESRDYANVRANITSPAVFDIPEECKSLRVEKTEEIEELKRHMYWL